jgi:hypothetical protein
MCNVVRAMQKCLDREVFELSDRYVLLTKRQKKDVSVTNS